MNGPTLFEGYDPTSPEPVEKLSAGRRLTIRQREAVLAGFHPLTKDRAHPELGTCGSCAFRSTAYGYPKCTFGADLDKRRAGPYMTRGPAADCRAWWPACHRHVPLEKES
jgi:hypothetical protein